MTEIEIQNKVIVTGTGRAGTTFLMQLLTQLGLDTGYRDVHEEVYENCNAGMERHLGDEETPYIVKSPHLCVQLEEVLKTGKVKIDHAFIPVRNLHDAAASRIAVWKDREEAPLDPNDGGLGRPGGLFHCYFPERQEDALARVFFELMQTITTAGIPHTLIDFPRLAREPEYLYEKLQPLVAHIAYDDFRKAFEEVADPSLIHSFEDASADSSVAPVFIPPSMFSFVPRHNVLSTWDEHTPFGYDLVAALRPSTVVELGTFSGMSFFAFCQSMEAHQIEGQCFAIDLWEGDEHNGFYGDDIYNTVRKHAEEHYADRTHLLRMQFNEAAPNFAPESIDLLHIDGLHTYEAVSEDFDTWYPKVRPGGVILVHDICARVSDFGVWKFWEECSARYESFTFHQGFGLGVVRKPGRQCDSSPLLDVLFGNNRGNREALRCVYSETAKYMALKRRFARVAASKDNAGLKKKRGTWRFWRRAA